MNKGSNETLLRHWTMLRRVPRSPAKITSRELTEFLRGEGFEVGKRTVERDLGTLSASFPLVSDERNKPFGWSWEREAGTFDLPGMLPAQALALALAERYLEPLLPVSLSMHLRPYFKTADRVLDTFPSNEGLHGWREKVAVVQPMQTMQPPVVDQDVLSSVHSALLQNLQLDMTYHPLNSSSPKKYVVHPLGLVQRGLTTYLCATVFSYTDVLIFAVHRIGGATLRSEPAVRPEGFQLEQYVKSGAFGFQEHGAITLRLRVSGDLAVHLRETPLSSDQYCVDDAEGWALVQATIQDTAQLRWWVLSQGDQVEVLEPVALREEITSSLRCAVQLYT